MKHILKHKCIVSNNIKLKMSSSIITKTTSCMEGPNQSEGPNQLEGPNQSCPICMDKIGSTNCAKTSCGHSFCLSCIIECLNTNHICPLCRKDIVEKKENTSGQKLRMENAVQIIEDEIDIFGLHQQLAMARQFGIRAIKTVVQSFALSAAHSIAIMQDGNEVDGSWEEMEDESDDEYASEADASEADASDDEADASEADASEADASDDEEGRVPPLRDACEAAGSSEAGRVPPLRDGANTSEAANASEAANRPSIFDRLGPRVEEE
jgi:hypothetical protein